MGAAASAESLQQLRGLKGLGFRVLRFRGLGFRGLQLFAAFCLVLVSLIVLPLWSCDWVWFWLVPLLRTGALRPRLHVGSCQN